MRANLGDVQTHGMQTMLVLFDEDGFSLTEWPSRWLLSDQREQRDVRPHDTPIGCALIRGSSAAALVLTPNGVAEIESFVLALA